MSKQVSRRVFGPKDPNTAGKRALETPVDPPGKRGVARREPHIDNMYIDSSSEDGEDSIEENPIADAIQSRASAGKQKNTSVSSLNGQPAKPSSHINLLAELWRTPRSTPTTGESRSLSEAMRGRNADP